MTTTAKKTEKKTSKKKPVTKKAPPKKKSGKEGAAAAAAKDPKCVTSSHTKTSTEGPSTSHSQGGATVRYSQRNGDGCVEYEKEPLPE